MSTKTTYQPCLQLDGDDSQTIENERVQQQNLISPSSTIPEQLECHIPSLPSPAIYQRCATRSRIAAAVICVVLLTFVIFTITAAKAKNSLKLKNGLNTGEQWMAEQQALGLSQESVVVDTICGKLIGDEEQEAFVFKGIPYASPPTGSRRWLPPLPLRNDSSHCNSNGQRHATKFGSPCFQINPYTKQFEGKEDCLYLNVWTPNIDQKANLAVMVWIHGGFLQFGSGHQPGLRPSGKLSKATNTVYVSLNYRLHAFGFMALDLLMNNSSNETSNNISKNDTNSTNFGIMDVILALQWIQININSFGGNPNKVTLFGADSGAAIILSIITNGDLKSLFSSSWLINPALYLNHSFTELSKHNRKVFLKHSQCDSLQCLKSLTSHKVVECFLGKNDPSFRINDQNDLPILGIMSEQLITIDDIYVRDFYPFDSIRTDTPILLGSSSQAIDFWPGPRDLSTWQWRDYSKYVTTSLDSFGSQVSRKALQLYAPVDDGNETTPAIQYINMVSDLRQVCPISYIADKKSNNSSIFRYIFNARLSEPVRVYDYPSNQSFHLIELISYFDQIETFIRNPTKEDFSIRDSIQQLVHSFVYNSNCNHNDCNNTNNLIHNSLSLGQSFPQQIIEINSQSNKTWIQINNYTQSDRCSFWQSYQLFNYVWTV